MMQAFVGKRLVHVLTVFDQPGLLLLVGAILARHFGPLGLDQP